MGITLKQIAELAGVHKSTVDKVIHNRPGVSDEVRQKIHLLLKEHGYEPNPLAKSLNFQKKKLTVAVVLPEVDAKSELIQGIEKNRRDLDSFNIQMEYHEIPVPDAAAQVALLDGLARRPIAGVILFPLNHPEMAEAVGRLTEAGIPVITLNSDLAGSRRLCFVGENVEQAGHTAARLTGLFLAGQGDICILSSQAALQSVSRREQAFLQYLPVCSPGIRVAGTVDTHENAAYAYRRTYDFLMQNPQIDGLFITCGHVADICRAVRDAGMTDRLKILCFERYPAILQGIQSGQIACTISSDLSGQGQLAIRLLFEYLVYGKSPASSEMYLESNILLKENI